MLLGGEPEKRTPAAGKGLPESGGGFVHTVEQRWTRIVKMDKEKIIHAHWKLAPEDTAYENVWVCSNCGEDFIQHRKPIIRYCPHCGAKMDKENYDGRD